MVSFHQRDFDRRRFVWGIAEEQFIGVNMARFTRLDTYQRLLEEGLLPVFNHHDAKATCLVVDAVAIAGTSVFEFTNRGDHAIEVFKELSHHCKKEQPGLILGAGSIIDEATAALYIAHGANFIVGPSFSERVARLCNRRKIAYIPGCQTATEIATAEEFGVEIVKFFPAQAGGGPDFIRQILGPSPWSRLLPTSIGEVSADALASWFQAGACAVGIGRELMPPESVDALDGKAITQRTIEIREIVRGARSTH
jgi:2-dehydro-3-deoxyphosphogluconate aldolase/(4S)-4-hydroxy-2-oxoglutarate aldolase